MTILPSCLGITHSFFNLILNAKVFVFIARISFGTYLVHLLIIDYFFADRTYDLYYTTPDLFAIYFGLLVLCLFFGFIVTITIELPFANILKNLTSKHNQNHKKAKIDKKVESLLTNESTDDEIIKVQK